MSLKPIFVVAGVGNGVGTGGATARLFAKKGYNIALIGRNAEHLRKAETDVKAISNDVIAVPVESYDFAAFETAFASIKQHFSGASIRVTLFNASAGVWKPFLDTTEADVKTTLDGNVHAAFGFARQSILAFQKNDLNDQGKRGTLIFTGATASIRGNTTTSAFAAGKHGVRALSQSLAKEFGKQNIHVAHAIIDGVILTNRTIGFKNDKEWEANEDARLNPDGIAQVYLSLTEQDRSALTWELDLRPAHEKW